MKNLLRFGLIHLFIVINFQIAAQSADCSAAQQLESNFFKQLAEKNRDSALITAKRACYLFKNCGNGIAAYRLADTITVLYFSIRALDSSIVWNKKAIELLPDDSQKPLRHATKLNRIAGCQYLKRDFANMQMSAENARKILVDNGLEKTNAMLENYMHHQRIVQEKADFGAAIRIGEDLRRLFPSVPQADTTSMLRSYMETAVAHQFSGNTMGAFPVLQEGLALANRYSKNDRFEHLFQMHNRLGMFYRATGQLQEAYVHGMRGIEFLQKASPPIKQLFTPLAHLNFAGTCRDLRDLQGFYQQIQLALKASDPNSAPHQSIRPTLMGNLSSYYAMVGDFEKAVEYMRYCLETDQKKGIPTPTQTAALGELGRLYLEQQRFEEAERYFLESYAVQEKLGQGQKMGTFLQCIALFQTAHAIGDIEKMDKWSAEMMGMVLKYPGKLRLDYPATAAKARGTYLIWKEKNYPVAIQQLSAALDTIHSKPSGFHHEVAQQLLTLCEWQLKSGKLSDATKSCDRALDLIRPTKAGKEIVLQASTLLQGLILRFDILLAVHQESGQNPSSFLPKMKAVLDEYATYLVASVNSNTPNIQQFLRGNDLEKGLSNYLERVAAFSKLTNQKEEMRLAFDVISACRAADFQSKIAENHAFKFAELPDSLTNLDAQLTGRIAWAEKKRFEAIPENSKETDALKDSAVLLFTEKIYTYRQEQADLRAFISKNYSKFYQLRYGLPSAKVSDVQTSLLASSQTWLEYFIAEKTIFVFVIRPDHFSCHEIPRGDLPLDSLIRVFRRATESSSPMGLPAFVAASRQLYDHLILPFAPDLQGELIIVPDKQLSFLPFEVLLTATPSNASRPATFAYFLEKHPLSYAISATLFDFVRQRPAAKKPATEAFLALAPFADTKVNLFADTSLRNRFQPLPFSGQEVVAAAKLMKGAYWVAERASLSNFQEAAQQYRILHIATHAEANDQQGDYSFLAFSNGSDSATKSPSRLLATEIYQMSLDADLVVLSACQTGLGKYLAGEGLIGLSRAFFCAGAKRLLTSFWSVNDQTTKNLMLLFYQELQKKDQGVNVAFWNARKQFLKKYPQNAHPFFWAGFVLNGELRSMSR